MFNSTDDWRVVATLDSVTEAEIVRGRLDAESIRAVINSGGIASGYDVMMSPATGVQVLVSPEDYDAATNVLASTPKTIDPDAKTDADSEASALE